MKVIRSNKNISPYGGVVAVLKQIKKFRVPQLIRSSLKKRRTIAKFNYQYADIIIPWMLTTYFHGKSLSHITTKRDKFSILPSLKLPAHDTLGRMMKQLATAVETKEGTAKKKKTAKNKYNENIELNRMLIRGAKQVGLLQERKNYTLHIDATFVRTRCHDAEKSYVGSDTGFNPMVCAIDGVPVFVSMRGGNVNSQFDITACLETCLKLLAENNIRVGKVACDAAGYNKEFMKMLDDRSIKFVMHATFHSKNKKMQKTLRGHNKWRSTQIKTATIDWDCEIGDISYAMADSGNTYRLVAVRVPNEETIQKFESEDMRKRRRLHKEILEKADEEGLIKKKRNSIRGWRGFEGYHYKLTISNDSTLTPEEIVLAYNKHAASEDVFEVMKNDFSWDLIPFSKLEHNTVFLILTAFAHNTHKGVLRGLAKVVTQLRANMRMMEFITTFIHVPCLYANRIYTFFRTNIAYEKIMQ